MSAPQGQLVSLTRTLVALASVKLALRTRGFRRTHRLFATAAVRRTAASVDVSDIIYTVSAAAAFLPWRALCLEQSLTLCYLLRRHGHDAIVRLGVRPHPFAAHAWVEIDGTPLGESPEHLRTFATFPSLS